jgi:hypothetical protein
MAVVAPVAAAPAFDGAPVGGGLEAMLPRVGLIGDKTMIAPLRQLNHQGSP